jgi:hypothetical protein
MRLSVLVQLLGLLILIAAHHSLSQSGSGGDLAVVPVRQNPLVVSGVGPECPGTLDNIVAEVEVETEQLLYSVVEQIECTYLGDC